MRLTRQNELARFGYEYIAPHRLEHFGEGISKLGQLEDIEDELGIDLITLFKAMKEGCYAYENGRIYKMKIVRVDSDELNSIILFRNASYGGSSYFLKDYGKTWSLDKNDLTKS